MKVTKALYTLKKFTESNKVLLGVVFHLVGTVSAILLGWMAITVSKRANEIGASQVEIAKRQAVMAEVEHQPHIRVTTSRDEPGWAIQVWNDAAPVRRVSTDERTFLALKAQEENGEYKLRHLPVHFFTFGGGSGESTGLIASISSNIGFFGEEEESFLKLAELKSSFYRRHEGAIESGVEMEILIFLAVEYEDRSGEVRQETFEVLPPHYYELWNYREAARRLTLAEADEVETAWQDALGIILPTGKGPRFYARALSVEDIISMWDECSYCSMWRDYPILGAPWGLDRHPTMLDGK